MKIFKSPVTVIYTLLASAPLFIGSLLAGSTVILPIVCVAVLLLTHIFLGRPKKSDGAGDEMMEALDKETLETAMKLPIMAGGGRTGSVNSYGRGATYVKKDARYHAGVLSWVIVFAGYFFFTILANAAVYGGKAAVDMGLFLPFFLGASALAAGDMANYFLRGKKPGLSGALLAASAIIAAGLFYKGLAGFII